MAALDATQLFWIYAAIQIAGLLSATLARLAENRAGQASFHAIFFAALTVVALVTVVSIGIGEEAWIVSGGTLGMMVVVAVWDSRTLALST